MRKLTEDEISQVIKVSNWANICSVSEDLSPYAIEATPFYMNDLTCFMINPRGGTWRNLQHNPKVLIKYTLADPHLKSWAGVSCYGTGKFISDSTEIIEGWRLLAKAMKQDYSLAAEKFSKNTNRSPFFAVTITERTGRCSAKKDQELNSLSILKNIAPKVVA